MVFTMILLALIVLCGLRATNAQSIGVCYGRVADNLPPAEEVVNLFKSNQIRKMRIYDADQATLEALRGSNIELMIGVPNEDIQSLATSASLATTWVQTNIQSYSQDVKFRYIVVGNEILPNDEIAQFVLPAMQNIYAALVSANLQSQIKVSTAIHISLLGNSYPPSAAEFSDSAISYIQPIVDFLKDKGAPLLANLYTYFSYIGDTTHVTLDFALFTSPTVTFRDREYEYQNLFDATLDALFVALGKIGAAEIEVVISESGWPSDGGIGATVDNARTYYQNLILHVPRGTPNRPNRTLETYLFAMFDEDEKESDETEKHFSLFTPNKQPKYQLNFRNIHSAAHVARQRMSLLFFVLIIFV